MWETDDDTAPSKVELLAAGEDPAYRIDGETLTLTIPADGTPPSLDVIKMQW